jgi:hypothetical protein
MKEATMPKSPLYFAAVQALHAGIFRARATGYSPEATLYDIILAVQKCLKDYDARAARELDK